MIGRFLLSDSYSYIRKLDSYILKLFLLLLIISILSLTGLYIVIHFFTNITDFIELTQENIFTFIPHYYLVRLPFILYKLLPIMVLVAVMMTITRLMKTRELTAMLSAGVGIHRIIMPIFILILFIIGIIYFTDEQTTPYLGKFITLTEKVLKSEGSDRFLVRRTPEYRFIIKKYNYPKQQMNDVWIDQYDRENNLIAQIFAEQGVWSTPLEANRRNKSNPLLYSNQPSETLLTGSTKKPTGWMLSNGIIYSYDTNGFRKSAPQLFRQDGFLLASELTPQSMESIQETSAYLNLAQLKGSISAQPHNYSLQVQYYSKMTAPLVILMLVFLGLPFAMVRKAQGFFSGIGVCLVVSLGFFLAKFFSESLGNKGLLPPLWAVVLPLVIFAVLGIILSRRIRT